MSDRTGPTFKVGQVLFVVLRKEATVYPVQVIEEVIKKTLEGVTTSYMVQAGAPAASKVVAMSDIDGEVFDSSEKAKSTLIDRVTSSISQRVDQASAKAREWYPTGFQLASDDPSSLVKKPATRAARSAEPREAEVVLPTEQLDEGTIIELPDGTRAKLRQVKLPDELKN